MKKVFLLAATAILSVTTLYAQKIKGSDTMLPLTQKFAENYSGKTGSAVSVTGGGSGVGIASLIDGTCDVAMASRKMKFAEKNNLKKKGSDVKEVVAGYDALAVIVNPANKVSNLTKEQIEGIYTGTITNWKQVGGDDMEIVVYSRETSSGTYEFFKEELLSKKNYKPSVLSMPATGAVMQSVAQTKGAIGYVGLAYLNNEVKSIAISYDQGETFIKPSFEHAKDGTYPVVRPLFYYYVQGKNANTDKFIDYVLTDDAQKTVKEIGYIPVK